MSQVISVKVLYKELLKLSTMTEEINIEAKSISNKPNEALENLCEKLKTVYKKFNDKVVYIGSNPDPDGVFGSSLRTLHLRINHATDRIKKIDGCADFVQTKGFPALKTPSQSPFSSKGQDPLGWFIRNHGFLYPKSIPNTKKTEKPELQTEKSSSLQVSKIRILCQVGEGNSLFLCCAPSWNESPIPLSFTHQGWEAEIPPGVEFKVVLKKEEQLIWEEGERNRTAQDALCTLTANDIPLEGLSEWIPPSLPTPENPSFIAEPNIPAPIQTMTINFPLSNEYTLGICCYSKQWEFIPFEQNNGKWAAPAFLENNEDFKIVKQLPNGQLVWEILEGNQNRIFDGTLVIDAVCFEESEASRENSGNGVALEEGLALRFSMPKKKIVVPPVTIEYPSSFEYTIGICCSSTGWGDSPVFFKFIDGNWVCPTDLSLKTGEEFKVIKKNYGDENLLWEDAMDNRVFNGVMRIDQVEFSG